MPTLITQADINDALSVQDGKIEIIDKSFFYAPGLVKTAVGDMMYAMTAGNVNINDMRTLLSSLLKGILEYQDHPTIELTLEGTSIAAIKEDSQMSGMSMLCEIFNPSMQYPVITKLSLPYNDIDSESGSRLADILINNHTLEHLDISRNIIGNKVLGKIIGAINTMHNLKYLCIGDSQDKVTDDLADSLIDVLDQRPNLVEVDIKNWRHNISDDRMNIIESLTLINKEQETKHLDLKGLKLRSFVIRRIFRDNLFTSLKLDNVALTDDLLFNICDHLKKPHCAITHLSIKNNENISTRGLIALSNAIKYQAQLPVSSLEEVDLRGIDITEEAARNMLDALKLNSKIKKYHFDGYVHEETMTKRSANELKALISFAPGERKEIAAQELSEQNFQDDISSLFRKRRTEEVQLLQQGRSGFKDLEKYFLQFSRSLMAEISPHLDDYNSVMEGKTFKKNGVDRALDGLEGVSRLIDGIELSPLTGTIKVDGISSAIHTAIDSVRSFRIERRTGDAQNAHNNLLSKNELSKPIEEAIHFIARGILISYSPQLEKLDPKTTKGVFDTMSKALVGEMTRDKNYAHISSVLDRSMSALFNGIAHDDTFPSKFKLTTKDPQTDKNWNLYSMIRRCGVTAFKCTEDENNPIEQIDMIRNAGGKAFRTGITTIDANFSDRQEDFRNQSREKYGNRLGSSLHVVITDSYEDYSKTKTAQTNPPSTSCAAFSSTAQQSNVVTSRSTI